METWRGSKGSKMAGRVRGDLDPTIMHSRLEEMKHSVAKKIIIRIVEDTVNFLR